MLAAQFQTCNQRVVNVNVDVGGPVAIQSRFDGLSRQRKFRFVQLARRDKAKVADICRKFVALFGLQISIPFVLSVISASNASMFGKAKPSSILAVIGFTTTPAAIAKLL